MNWTKKIQYVGGAIAVAALMTTTAGVAHAELSLSKVKVAFPFTVLVQRAAIEGARQAG